MEDFLYFRITYFKEFSSLSASRLGSLYACKSLISACIEDFSKIYPCVYYTVIRNLRVERLPKHRTFERKRRAGYKKEEAILRIGFSTRTGTWLQIDELSGTLGDYLEQTRLNVEGERFKAHCAYKGDPGCQHIKDFAVLTHPQPLQLVQDI